MTFQGEINYIYIERPHNTLFQWFYNFDVWWNEEDILLWENKNSATGCSVQTMITETEEHEWLSENTMYVITMQKQIHNLVAEDVPKLTHMWKL